MCDNGCGRYEKTGGSNTGESGEVCEEVPSKDPNADVECFSSPYFTAFNETIMIEMCTNNCTSIIPANRQGDDVIHKECGTI
jgi:hypothetical protein